MNMRMKRRRVTGKTAAAFPTTFTPRFITEADGRHSVVKEARRRMDLLKLECGADSYAKSVLAERAIYLLMQIESLELTGYEGKPTEQSVHTQMTNTLMGILKTLGLDKRMKDANLDDYLEGLKEKERKDAH